MSEEQVRPLEPPAAVTGPRPRCSRRQARWLIAAACAAAVAIGAYAGYRWHAASERASARQRELQLVEEFARERQSAVPAYLRSPSTYHRPKDYYGRTAEGEGTPIRDKAGIVGDAWQRKDPVVLDALARACLMSDGREYPPDDYFGYFHRNRALSHLVGGAPDASAEQAAALVTYLHQDVHLPTRDPGLWAESEPDRKSLVAALLPVIERQLQSPESVAQELRMLEALLHVRPADANAPLRLARIAADPLSTTGLDGSGSWPPRIYVARVLICRSRHPTAVATVFEIADHSPSNAFHVSLAGVDSLTSLQVFGPKVIPELVKRWDAWGAGFWPSILSFCSSYPDAGGLAMLRLALDDTRPLAQRMLVARSYSKLRPNSVELLPLLRAAASSKEFGDEARKMIDSLNLQKR